MSASRLVGVLVPIAGIALDRSMARYKCSNPSCIEILEADAETCPECGGLLVGEIANADERLDAEESWFEAHPEVRRKANAGDAAAEPRADDSELFRASQCGVFDEIPPDLEVLLAVSAEKPDEIGQFELTSGEICLYVFTAASRFDDWDGRPDFEVREIAWSDVVGMACESGLGLKLNPSSDPVVIRAFEVATLAG